MTDAVFCLMDLFLAKLNLSLSFALLILFLFDFVLLLFPSHSFLPSHDLTKPAILFFVELHRHNYCIIASDSESVAVDVSLRFITDTQPSALFSVGVYPSCLPSLLHNMVRGISFHRY